MHLYVITALPCYLLCSIESFQGLLELNIDRHHDVISQKKRILVMLCNRLMTRGEWKQRTSRGLLEHLENRITFLLQVMVSHHTSCSDFSHYCFISNSVILLLFAVVIQYKWMIFSCDFFLENVNLTLRVSDSDKTGIPVCSTRVIAFFLFQ